jgi:hypothetical protein
MRPPKEPQGRCGQSFAARRDFGDFGKVVVAQFVLAHDEF